MDERVADPSSATSPSAVAWRTAARSDSTTTMRLPSKPFSRSAATALRPFVP
jgi:hypothetical protein